MLGIEVLGMESPFWHGVGIFGVAGFLLAIVLILVARHWFGSANNAKAKIGARILSYLGGAANARSIDLLIAQRKMK